MPKSIRQKLIQAYINLNVFTQGWLEAPLHKFISTFQEKDIAILYQFHSTPYGGGNQFLKALWNELARRGLKLENNSISRTTRACLINSHHINPTALRKLLRPGCRVVHRVDGPIGVYRGKEEGLDHQIWFINQDFADVTVFQSRYSLEKHLEMGLQFKSPVVILNASDPTIFFPRAYTPFNHRRKIRLISTSWSSNPNKGAEVYRQLEQLLDWARYEYTFVGNSPIRFERIRMIPPMPSEKLANTLRQHDIFITASQNDPCSNSLIEAITCGLPAIYLRSGGHAEIVAEGGEGFTLAEEIPALLDKLVINYEAYSQRLSPPTIHSVADQYLQAMGAVS